MTSRSPLTDRAQLEAHLRHLCELWPRRAELSPDELTPAGLAWQMASTAGLLERLGADPVAICPPLAEAELVRLVAGALDPDTVAAGWDTLAERTRELETLQEHAGAPDDDEAGALETVRELADVWILERDETERALEPVRRAARHDSEVRECALTLMSALAEIDDRARGEIEVLFPALPLCRGMLAAWEEVGARPDPRELWWWHAPVRRFDELRSARAVGDALALAARGTPDAESGPSDRVIRLDALRQRFLERIGEPSGAVRLAAQDDGGSAGLAAMQDVQVDVEGETYTLRFGVGEDGDTLLVYALDHAGRPTADLDNRQLVVRARGGSDEPERLALFEGAEAVVYLGPDGVGSLADPVFLLEG